MSHDIEQLRKVLHMNEDSNEEEIIMSAQAMVNNIELIIATTTDDDVKKIAMSKLQMLQKYLPENREDEQLSDVQGQTSKTERKTLIRASLCSDKYLSVSDREKMERAVAEDQSAEADYIRAVLAMKRISETKTLEEASKDVTSALKYIKAARDKEPENRLYGDYYQTLEKILKKEEERKQALVHALKQREREMQRAQKERLEREAYEAEQRRREVENEEGKSMLLKFGGGILAVICVIETWDCCSAVCESSCGCLGC